MLVHKARGGLVLIEAVVIAFVFAICVALIAYFLLLQTPEHIAEQLKKANREFGESNSRRVVYFYDARTGLCFATNGHGLALVPCDKVQDQLLNPKKLEPMPVPGQ